VDRAGFAVAFALRLREAGVAVGFSSIESFARGLEVCPPDSMGSLYWVARVTLLPGWADLERFDAVFAAVFSTKVLSLDPNARRRGTPTPGDDKSWYSRLPAGAGADEDGLGLPWATLPRAVGPAAMDETPSLAVPERLASEAEAVADIPFEALDRADLALLDDWLLAALRRWPRRRSRRLATHHAGRRVGLRQTVARARRTGFEPVELVRTRAVRRPRRMVMLCDVSQSMQHHAAAYLHLMRAVVMVADAEVFAFSTSLTRLTAVLTHHSPEIAVEQATAKVTDRFGGTRIATNVRALLSSRHGDACRGAIVVVASDGWDSDPPEALAAAMARLRRRAYRVIWLNPRLSAPGFAPLVGGMAAALPYCDAVLPADTVRALSDVVAAIAAWN
jgi:uncharacterized protein with von Willebrand factor type A (vWA) domain